MLYLGIDWLEVFVNQFMQLWLLFFICEAI